MISAHKSNLMLSVWNPNPMVRVTLEKTYVSVLSLIKDPLNIERHMTWENIILGHDASLRPPSFIAKIHYIRISPIPAATITINAKNPRRLDIHPLVYCPITFLLLEMCMTMPMSTGAVRP